MSPQAELLALVATLFVFGVAVVLLAIRWYFDPWARGRDRRWAARERRRRELRRRGG